MFGYVRPLTAELKVGEYRYYRAAYCRICKELGAACGHLSRAFLSYDLTFLLLLLSGVCGEKTSVEKHRCPVNPTVRRDMTEGSSYAAYCAAACGVLAAYRFRDDKTDETGLRRAAACAGCGASASWIAKVKKKYPGLCEGLESRLCALSDAEAEAKAAGNVLLDTLSGKFGEVLRFLCAYPFPEDATGADREKRIICDAVGLHVGRWIYCVDAIDDMKKDEKKGRFNPFLLAYGRSEFTEDEKMTLKCLLGGEAGEAALALQLCENFPDATPEPLKITENILELGLPDVAAAVIGGTYRKTGRDRI